MFDTTSSLSNKTAAAYAQEDYYGTRVWGFAPDCVPDLESVSVAVKRDGQWTAYEAFPIFEKERAEQAGVSCKNEEGAFSLTIDAELQEGDQLFLLQHGDKDRVYHAAIKKIETDDAQE